MGVAIEGGLISSLLLTLVIVPSVFGYVDDFRLWLTKIFSALNAGPAVEQVGKKVKKSSFKLGVRSEEF
jgi:HAE1 family hydrophobic/amphiphilic exporter-1